MFVCFIIATTTEIINGNHYIIIESENRCPDFANLKKMHVYIWACILIRLYNTIAHTRFYTLPSPCV